MTMNNQYKKLLSNLKKGKGCDIYVCNMCDMKIRKVYINDFQNQNTDISYHYQYCKGYGHSLYPDGSAAVIKYHKKVENAFVWGFDKEELRKNINRHLTEFKKNKLRQFDSEKNSWKNFDWNEFLMYYINNNVGSLFRRFVKGKRKGK